MLTSDLTEYVIDLDRPEASRWDAVIAAEKDAARPLFAEAEAQFQRVPELLRWVFGWVYRRTGGLYAGEIAAWAKALGISVGTATILNCAYELSHLRTPRVFGCSAGVRWVTGLGLVHVRCLDWPLATLGPATRLFRFRRGLREFVAVSVPGSVGVLSGMVPHAYSVTINWAPPIALPTFEYGPAFLLREVLETCDTYAAAVQRLRTTVLSTSVFYVVCGTSRAEACVIERTQRGAEVRPLTEGPLVQTNHHVAPWFARHNTDIVDMPADDLFSLVGSTKRADQLRAALAALPSGCDLATVARALNVDPVLNHDTGQQMVFCPASGEMLAWRTTG